MSSVEVYTILTITGIALFIIYFILMKIDKKFAGFALMMLGFTMFALPEKVPNIATYIYISVWVMVLTGMYVMFYGLVNKE